MIETIHCQPDTGGKSDVQENDYYMECSAPLTGRSTTINRAKRARRLIYSFGVLIVILITDSSSAQQDARDHRAAGMTFSSESVHQQGGIKPGAPIEVTTTLTYYDRDRTYCFVQTGDFAQFVDFEGEWPKLPNARAGDIVRLTGHYSQTQDSINISDLEIIGHGELPSPIDELLTEMWLGKHWGRWIVHEGNVVHATCLDNATYLGLTYDDVYFTARIAHRIPPDEAKELIGAKVRISGALACDNETGSLERFVVYVMSGHGIEVLRPGPSWIEPSESKLEHLNSFPTDARVRFRAAIGHAHPYEWMLAEDNLNIAKVRIPLTNRLFPGQQADIYATKIGEQEYEAILIVAGTGETLLNPVALSASEYLNLQTPLLRVNMSGNVMDITSHGKRRRIQLEDDGIRFYADFIASDQEFEALQLDSAGRIGCVGCAELFAEQPQNPLFAIRANSASDITIEDRVVQIRRKWWLAATSLVSAIILMGGLWMVVMRQQVKQRTKQLSLLNARLAASYEAIQEGVMLTNSEGKLLRSNRRLAEIFGFEPSARLPEDIMNKIAPEMGLPHEFTDWFHDASGSNTPCQTREFTTNSSPPRYIVVYTAPVFGSRNGAVTARIWTFEDVTERKALEAQLRQSQKLEILGMLAGGIAHNFNNLLSVIGMNLELLLESKQRTVDERVDSLIMAHDATQRAATVVSQLLGFSRNQPLNMQVVHPQELISRIHQFLRPLIPTSISIETNITENIGNIRVDVAQLEQVLMNLCINARDAIDGTGKISIDVFACEDSSGPTVAIRVSDDGCGIPESNQSRIFDPFFSTKGPSEGTGLGLTDSVRLVQQHRGTISVQSSEGVGSSFTVQLPIAEQPIDDAIASVGDAGHQVSGLRLLLADDEDAVRHSTAIGLEHFGFVVVEARDGVEALEILKDDRRFAAVILDQSMPRISGLETLRRIRLDFPDLPVVLYSGNVDREAINRLDAPPECVVSKPFSLNEMQKSVLAAIALTKS